MVKKAASSSSEAIQSLPVRSSNVNMARITWSGQ
jgi:hypothetical protein